MLSYKTIIASAVVALSAGSALAYEDIKFNLVNVPSWDGLGDPNNADAVADLNLALGRPSGSPVTVIGVGWEVELRTNGVSFLSEPALRFDDADAPGSPTLFYLTPGAGDFFPGTKSYSSSGVIDLSSVFLPDLVLSQGNLALEFFEQFDDFSNEIDAYWNGSVVVRVAGEAVPLPSGAVMGLAGLGACACVRRRRV